MSDLVSIASGAVSVYQRALGVVSNNIANVGSVGYSRQEANLIEGAPRQQATTYLGTGVVMTGVRRLYDEFIENSLRDATTELGTQTPLLNYANRVVNIMGSEDVGLLSAFDQFFDAARQLSSDPSSLILRSQFVSKAEGLASRFQTLEGQLQLVEQESREAIATNVNKLNNLSSQLAQINTQLLKTKYLERQPPALLDQRDQVLREMAELAKIRVSESSSGVVTVRIGSSNTAGVLVENEVSRPVSTVFSNAQAGKIDLVINRGVSNAEIVSGFTGGAIAGLMGFRSQLLEPVVNELNDLAKVVIREVNAIHREGIDLQGRNGQDVFSVDPQFTVTPAVGETQAVVAASLKTVDDFSANSLQLSYQANSGQVNNLSLSGEFRVGDQIVVTLNGLSKALVLSGAVSVTETLSAGTVLELPQVQQQLRNFLEGGQRLSPEELADYYRTGQASLEGAFGRQLAVEPGVDAGLIVTSPVLGAYNLSFRLVNGVSTARVDNLETRGQWTVTDTVTGRSATGVGSAEINGIKINFSGSPRDGEILFLNIGNNAAAGIRLAIEDPNRIAAAARFRVIENQFNPSGAGARLFETPQDYAQDRSLWLDRVVSDDGRTVLDNNSLVDQAIRFDRIRPTPISIIPAGYADTSLYLGDLNGEPIDLQVFTRDGRHLLGRQLADLRIAQAEQSLGRELTREERQSLIDQAGEEFMTQARLAGVSFEPGASYSTQYLNAADELSYRGMELFYGVKASVQEVPRLNEDHVFGSIERIPAEILSGRIGIQTAVPGEAIYQEGALTLNGQPLGALRLEQVNSVPTLFTEFTDREGRLIRRQVSVENLPAPDPGNPGAFRIKAEHLQAWMHSQPAWGRGEQQTLSFSGIGSDGTLSLVLPGITAGGADKTLNLTIAAGATPSEVAQQVANAIGNDADFASFKGRHVQAFDDGQVLIEFALTETARGPIQVSSADSGISSRLTRDPASQGSLGVGEQQVLRFGPATAAGSIRVGDVDVAVAQGDSSLQVANKVAQALRTRTENYAGLERLGYDAQGIGLDVGADGSLTVRFAAALGNVTNLGFSSAVGTPGTDTGVFMNLTTRDFRGLEIALQLDVDRVVNPNGSVSVFTDSDEQPFQSLRFRQTLLGQGEEQTLSFSNAIGNGEIEIGGVRVAVLAETPAKDIAQAVKRALEREYGSSSLTGSQREFILNLDGTLTVRSSPGAGNVRDLTLSNLGTAGVTMTSVTREFVPDGERADSQVRIGLGSAGFTTNLASLGFRTGVYVSGTVKEDLLVFSSLTHVPNPDDLTQRPDLGASFRLGATYRPGSLDAVAALRAEPFEVVFTSNSRYQIVDRNTGSVVADRQYDPQLGIGYRGTTLFLNRPPLAGDRFAVDGNVDGIGNNANMIRIAELQNARIVGGAESRTLSDAYGQTVTNIGNLAFQSSIAQKALEVVKDQAVQARDKVSGVSLDEEAADLIRFQQAYQASAKVMQTASTLFDAIIGIR